MPQGRVIVGGMQRSICNIGQFLCKNNQLQICFIDFIGSHRVTGPGQQSDTPQLYDMHIKVTTMSDMYFCMSGN